MRNNTGSGNIDLVMTKYLDNELGLTLIDA
jgi:hypothetical protein